MRILLLGGSGQIGWELQRSLAPLGEVVAPPHANLDLLDLIRLRETLRSLRPGAIVNAAAYNDVDKAESEPDLAQTLNAAVPEVLATEARASGAALIHYSTDYVFDGSMKRPYIEDDAPRPLSAYGRTKLEGERAVQDVGGASLVLRTGWVYSLRRACFVTRVLEWARQRRTLTLTDQVGSPTWCRPVAQATAGLLGRVATEGQDWLRERAGLYHLVCNGWADRYDWALAILDLDPKRGEQVVQSVQRAPSADFAAPARRPAFSALDSSLFDRTFGIRLPDWRDALRSALTLDAGLGDAPAGTV